MRKKEYESEKIDRFERRSINPIEQTNRNKKQSLYLLFRWVYTWSNVFLVYFCCGWLIIKHLVFFFFVLFCFSLLLFASLLVDIVGNSLSSSTRWPAWYILSGKIYLIFVSRVNLIEFTNFQTETQGDFVWWIDWDQNWRIKKRKKKFLLQLHREQNSFSWSHETSHEGPLIDPDWWVGSEFGLRFLKERWRVVSVSDSTQQLTCAL